MPTLRPEQRNKYGSGARARIALRVSDAEREAMERAAEKAGLKLSAWLRIRGARQAERETAAA